MTLKYRADRILVRCPNWVGDAVMATPALRCIRRNYPDAHIALLLRPSIRKTLENAPWFDEIIEYEPPRGRAPSVWVRDIAGLRRAARRLREERFDLALLLTHSFRSALIARMAGIPHRVANTRGDQAWLLTDSVPWPREKGKRVPLPKTEAYMRLCRALGCEGTEDRRQELFFDDALKTHAEALLRKAGANEQQPIFGLVPGASFGPSKRWRPERFAEVADEIVERRGWQAAILSGPGEEELTERIARAMKNRPLCFDPKELSLDVLKPVVAMCRLLITTDTGPRHFGVAFGVPTVVIMGPTDPRHTESDYDRTVILRHEVPCGPCHLRVCPRDHQCMEAITLRQVLDAAETLLASVPS